MVEIFSSFNALTVVLFFCVEIDWYMVLVLEGGITQFGFVYYVYLFCSVSVYIANGNKKRKIRNNCWKEERNYNKV